MDPESPYKVFSGGVPKKVFSSGQGTAKVFSDGGLCMSASPKEPTPGLYKATGAGVYLLDPLPSVSARQ